MTNKTPARVLDPKTLAAQMGNYLRGYGHHNPQALASLITYRPWAVMARRELDARAARFVSVFSNDELEAIVRGDVNLCELGREILKEIQRKKT